jgi:peptidoglycan/xylan/chitin deacetylase (PgdA/CDA1 family)
MTDMHTYRLSVALRRLFIFILIAIPFLSLEGQDQTPWKNKKCAIVLTYDDALNVHLDNVVPLLDSLGFKATFYIAGSFPGFKARIQDWRKRANDGHELGNHTLFHPCEGKVSGREWVKPDYDLNTYTINRITGEIDLENTLLEAVDGKTKRTFAYPCGDMKAGDSSYVDTIKEIFVGARGVEGKMQKIDEIDLYNIGCYMINGQSGDELIALVKNAIKKNALVVFLFHGVGGEHTLNVSLEAHRTLLRFLKQCEKDIWVAPMIDIADYVRENQKSSENQK